MRGSGNRALGDGENTVRLVVPGKSKAIVRVPSKPTPNEAEVNDGSIPEAERRDNVVPVTAAPPAEH